MEIIFPCSLGSLVDFFLFLCFSFSSFFFSLVLVGSVQVAYRPDYNPVSIARPLQTKRLPLQGLRPTTLPTFSRSTATFLPLSHPFHSCNTFPFFHPDKTTINHQSLPTVPPISRFLPSTLAELLPFARLRHPA